MGKQKQKTEDGSRKIVTKEKPEIARLEQLEELLAGEIELAAKLKEALETDRFFITVTFQKKYSPEDEHDLHHYYIRKNFMVNDVVPSLKKLAADFIARENPTAELPDKSQWH